MIKNKFNSWMRSIWKVKHRLIIALILIFLAGMLNYKSGIYSDKFSSDASSDFILDFLPVIDVSFIYVYLFLIVMAILYIYSILKYPEKCPYFLSMIALLIILRSGFIALTHLQTPEGRIYPYFPFPFDTLVFSNDLFFSGHTALPFLGFLIYKNSKIKWLFLISSFIIAGSTLLMHQHYSIDVFAAFFITYGFYKIANKFFNKINWN